MTRLTAAPSSVDLHQGTEGSNQRMLDVAGLLNSSKTASMPPLNRFKRIDVRPLLDKGREPLPEILRRIRGLKPDEGLIVIAPFLPSPLIERLGSDGYESKIEPAPGGQWIVYLWRES